MFAARRDRFSSRSRLFLESLEDRWTPTNYPVTSDLDAGANTLRDAVRLANEATANGNAGPHTISFMGADVGGDDVIVLQSEITINCRLTIIGPVPGEGETPLEIRGRVVGPGPTFTGNRIFKVAANHSLTIEKMTLDTGIARGSDPNGGIARVDAGASLTLRNTFIDNGIAQADGGAIWVGDGGKLYLYGARFGHNKADRNGGAVALVNPHEFTVGRFGEVATTFNNNEAGNDGGAIWLTGQRRATTPPVTLTRVGFLWNVAGRDGGGIHFTWAGANHSPKPILIENSSIDANYADRGFAGGAYISGDARVVGGSVKANTAQTAPAGIYFQRGRVDFDGKTDESENRLENPPQPNPSLQAAALIDTEAEVVAIGEHTFDAGFGAGPGYVYATSLRNAGKLYPSDSDNPEGIGQVIVSGSYDQVGTGLLDIDLDIGDNDQLVVNGGGNKVLLAGGLFLREHWTTPPSYGTVYTIIENNTDTSTVGTFDGYPDGHEFWLGGAEFRINYGVYMGDPNDVILTVITAGTVTGSVWYDWNGDGIQGNDVPPVGYEGTPNAWVALFDVHGNMVANVFSVDGTYTFEDVIPGQYTITASQASFVPTAQNQGTDDAVDSDINGMCSSDVFTVVEAGVVDLDAGFVYIV